MTGESPNCGCCGGDGTVKTALDYFDVPEGREHFLYSAPSFYVGAVDGKMTLKEYVATIVDSYSLGFAASGNKEEKKDFDEYAEKLFLRFRSKSGMDDLHILTEGIHAMLSCVPDAEATRIKEFMGQMCNDVAEASGPLFGENTSPEEKAMIERIFKMI